MDKGEEPKWSAYEPILVAHQKALEEQALFVEKGKRKPAPPPGPAPPAPRPAPVSPRRPPPGHDLTPRPPAAERVKVVDTARHDPRRNLPRLQPLQRDGVPAESKSARSGRSHRKHREQVVMTPDSDIQGELVPIVNEMDAMATDSLEEGIAAQVKAVMHELAGLRQLKQSLVAKLTALKRRVQELTQEKEEEEDHCLKVTRKLHEESERCRGFQLRLEDVEEQNTELKAVVEELREALARPASASVDAELHAEVERLRADNRALRSEVAGLRKQTESQDDRWELEKMRQDVRIAEDQMQALRRTLTETVISNKEMARELAVLKAQHEACTAPTNGQGGGSGAIALQDASKDALLASAPALLEAYCGRLALAIEKGHKVSVSRN